MAACSADYLFTMVDIGAPGRLSDGGVFKNSSFGSKLESNEMNLPKPSPLPYDGPIMPYVFVADEAFQLTSYMMRPYPRKSVLTRDKRVFNYRLSRARRVIENTFGILVAKWRIFRRPINTNVNTAINIVKAAVCLHNYVKIMVNNLLANKRTYHTSNLTDTDDKENGEWRVFNPRDTMYSVKNIGSNFHSSKSTIIRNNFKNYFCNEGSVEWQWDRADRADF